MKFRKIDAGMERAALGTVADYAEGRISETAYIATAWGFKEIVGLRFWAGDPFWIVLSTEIAYSCVSPTESLYSAPRPRMGQGGEYEKKYETR